MPGRSRSVDPALLAIIAEAFLSRLSSGLISFALPLYAYHLGLSLVEIGVLTSLNLAAAMLLKPFTGRMADRFGLKRSYSAAILLRSVITLLLVFAAAPWQLYALRSARGVSKSLRDPPVKALLAEHGGKRAVASAFAWYESAKSLAGTLGKATAGIVLTLSASNFALVFFISFLLSVLPLVVVVRYVKGGRIKELHEPPPVPETPKSRSLAPYLGFGFLIATTVDMLSGLFPILATEYAGLSEAQTGLVYLLSSLVILSFGPLFGWLADNVSQTLVLLVRGVANTLASLLYLAFPSLAGIMVGKAMDEVGKAAFRPAWGAMMAEISARDKRRRAQTMGMLSVGEDAGGIVGPILGGLLWSLGGVGMLLGVRIGLALVTEAYAVVLTRKLSDNDNERTLKGPLAAGPGKGNLP
jgi:MFS family permease